MAAELDAALLNNVSPLPQACVLFRQAAATIKVGTYIQPSVPNSEEKPLAISTSIPPDLPPKQQKLFRDVLEKLNECGVPYAVSGAFALRKHTGICRDTKDLDVFLPAAAVKRTLEC